MNLMHLASVAAMVMEFPARLYWIAATASERLLFSLEVGTLLAVIVWLLLRMFPKKDSRTSFAVWFATLVTTAALPVASLYLSSTRGAVERSSGAVVMISATWAVYLFFAWFSLASIGLARVAVALWQVFRLRRESAALDAQVLDPELKNLIEESRHGRSVELRVSRQLEVPTAIGFFKPAILLPEWLLKETPVEELKYILLHELAHLRRRDDWTNLAQQIVKALLFFVPSVWWIERRLELDREMACDDAVLAQSGTPHGYAECLARVAERSFMRRQLALAQAAVSKLRQLTVRVARILDPNRQQATPMWKPAVPAVVVVAGLCAFTASQSPRLVGFSDAQQSMAASAGESQHAAVGSLAQSSMGAKAVPPVMMSQPAGDGQAKFVAASLKTSDVEHENKKAKRTDTLKVKREAPHKLRADKPELLTLTNLRAENKIPRGLAVLPGLERAQPEYVTVREELTIVVAQRGDAPPESWHVRVVTISVTQWKPQKQIPKKI